MKKITTRLCRTHAHLLFLLLVLASCYHTGRAQTTNNIMWPNAPGGPVAGNLIDRLIAISDEPEWINCDIYSDMSTQTSQNEVIAIVWDELNGNTVHFYIYDIDAATVVDWGTISNARRPDVVIGDRYEIGTTAPNGDARVIIVYENTNTQDIEFDYIELEDCMGFGSPTSLGLQGSTLVSSGANDAFYPHIDAFFSDPNGTKYFTGSPPPDYIALGEFVITWTEDNGGTDEIYVEDGLFEHPGFPVGPLLNGNTQYVADGRRSDIAGVRSMSMNAERWAHLVYIDDNDDLVYNFYDIDAPSFSPSVIETAGSGSSYTILGWPRIEATNVHRPASPNNINWKAVALLDSSGYQKVHSYDGYNGTTNFAAYTPISPISTTQVVASHPAVSTGPGLNDITQLGQHGNLFYQIGYFLDDLGGGAFANFYVLEAQVDGFALAGYAGINSNTISSSVDHVLALGESSNCGHGFMAAWNNFEPIGMMPAQHTIGWKFSPVTNAVSGYKPANVGTISPDLFVISPNPASNFVRVEGINVPTSYSIVDMAGRLVSQGRVDKNNSDINIASLTQGMYIVQFNENGKCDELKLIKQ